LLLALVETDIATTTQLGVFSCKSVSLITWSGAGRLIKHKGATSLFSVPHSDIVGGEKLKAHQAKKNVHPLQFGSDAPSRVLMRVAHCFGIRDATTRLLWRNYCVDFQNAANPSLTARAPLPPSFPRCTIYARQKTFVSPRGKVD